MPHIVHTFAIFLSLIIGMPAFAQQVRFTGNTTADTTLIRDALRNVMLYSQARLGCDRLESVVSEVLPRDYIPPGPPGPEGKAPATYERWTITLCGKTFPFLVVFWQAEQGGTMFRVTSFQAGSTPSPAVERDAPPAARPAP